MALPAAHFMRLLLTSALKAPARGREEKKRDDDVDDLVASRPEAVKAVFERLHEATREKEDIMTTVVVFDIIL